MSCLQRGDRPSFQRALKDSRLQTMSRMQGLSCRNEAYGRAYPSLLQLHMLREAEEGFELLQRTRRAKGGGETEGGSDCGDKPGADWSWKHRLDLLSPSLQHRDQVMAVRRGIFEMSGLVKEVADNWLCLSEMRRRNGDLQGARVALRHAEVRGLDSEQVLIRECTLIKEGGNISEAIALLEPLELDVAASRLRIKKVETKNQGGMEAEAASRDKEQLAHRLLLTAQWLSLSHVKHGKAIIDRYKLALDLHKDWEAANFELAKYYEVVAEKRRGELESKQGGVGALAGDDIFLTNSVVSRCNAL